MAGRLTIHSSGDGHLLSGHSWIEYQPDGGDSVTYGTWGNDPLGLGNGMHVDLEKGRSSDVERTVQITDQQEKKLIAKIEEYEKKGKDGWSILHPCSAFAADAWQAVTGEKLNDRSYGIISNPSKLKESIEAANGKTTESAAKPSGSRPPSSRRPISAAIQPCGAKAASQA